MQNGKFLRLFNTLEKRERTLFRKYLHRRYAHEQVGLEVYEYIHRHRRDGAAQSKLGTDDFNRGIFGTRTDFDGENRTRLLNALSDLHLWLREFLLLGMLKENIVEIRFLWLAILRARGLEVDYEREVSRLYEEQRRAAKGSVRAYLREVATGYFYYFQSDREKKPDDVARLQEHNRMLDVYYAVSWLKTACELLNARNLMAATIDLGSSELVLSRVQDNLADHPLLAVYYEIFLLLSEHPRHDYTRAERLVLGAAAAIEKEELEVVLAMLSNYTQTQGNTRQPGWERLHLLNRLALEQGIFAFKGVLSAVRFNTTVNVACKALDFTWAEAFIESQQGYLRPGVRAQTVALARAIIAFEKRDFQGALDLLTGVRPKDIHSNIRGRSLELCCRYELRGDPAELLDFCNNFRASLRRTTSPRRLAVLRARNFVLITKMLIERKKKPATILGRIEQTKHLNMREWLRAKAQGYKY